MKTKKNAALKNKSSSTSGITLIALVITIIILLILAGISIQALTNQGLFQNARKAKIDNEIARQKEIVEMAINSSLIENMGIKDNVSVESVLGEIRKSNNNSTDIYAVKGSGLIIATKGTTKFEASFLFPKETVNLDKGIKIDVDENLNIINAVTTEVDSVDEALAEIEVNKANIELNLIWENETPKVTYRETTGADVTIQYMIGTNGTLKDATGGVISEPTLKLGDTVFVIVSKDGKQRDGGSVLVLDETPPKITKFEIKENTEDSITVEVTATDNESGLATIDTYTYYKDGTMDGKSTTDNTHVYASLTEGTYKLEVEVVDKAGNKAIEDIDGTIEETTAAGLYDSEGTKLANWNTLVKNYNLNIEKDYDYSTYKTNNADGNSIYYVLQQDAFENKTGLSITIPDGVTSIGNYAFRNCDGLTSVTIPDSVTSIGYSAFNGCASLTSVTIPDSVTSIDESAFCNCSGLTSVTIPDSVTSIDEYAFSFCSGLTSVTIPDSVTSIGLYAFMECRSLTSVTIPDSVTSIGYSAFHGCASLTSVTIPDSVTRISSDTFAFCTSLTSVTIPDSVTSIDGYAFYDCTSLTSVTIPDSVTSIDEYAFCDCSGLTSVTIGSGVTSIGNYAFRNCDSLTSVTIPDSVTDVGEGVFEDCNSLTSVTIGSGVTSIGNYAFRNCDSLTSVTIPDSVTDVGEGVFEDCNSLTSVTIGSGVTSIGNYAFRNCDSLTSVTIPDSVTDVGEGVFEDCNSLTSVTIGSGVTSIGNYAFRNCDSLTSVTIGSGVTSIGNYAFRNCDSLTSVTIPDSVTDLGEGVFEDCTRLTSVTIGSNVEVIRGETFVNCYNLNITVPSTVLYIYSEYVFDGCASVYYERGREYYFGGVSGESSESGESGSLYEFSVSYIGDSIYISTPHNYLDGMSASYSYSFSDAQKVILEFSSESCLEDSYDYVEIYDGNSNLVYSSYENGSDALSSLRVEVTGNSFTINMYSDGSVNYYGFECTVSPEY